MYVTYVDFVQLVRLLVLTQLKNKETHVLVLFVRDRLNKALSCAEYFQGLKANVLQQFEENARLALQSQNQDSSDRVRSGSYSEAALRR